MNYVPSPTFNIRQLAKFLASILLCLLIPVIGNGIYLGYVGYFGTGGIKDYIGGVMYVFFILFFYGIWYYLFGVLIFHLVVTLFKTTKTGYYLVLGASIGFLLPLSFPIVFRQYFSFADVQGFPSDLIWYALSGALYGWLYVKWINKEAFQAG